MSGDFGASGDGRAARLVAGRYRLVDRLGHGGMGVVWRARDELLDREVAVKEVRAPAGLLEHEVTLLHARLEREGRAAARIAHPNVVTVHDVATEDGRPWIVMELVRGLSLADVLEAEGRLAPARAAHIGAEVLAALRAAHGVGVLHRDVKPGNVLVAADGRVVLTDFGIATVQGNTALTRTGELVGSPEYLAPERALGRPPGTASDLWSLGVMLYAAVEGFSPFRQDTPLSTMRAVVDQVFPPPRRAGALTPVLEGLLRKDPAERLGAAEAERMLRAAAAGAAPVGRAPDVPYAPTVVAHSAPPAPDRARAGGDAPRGPDADGPVAPAGPDGGRRKRTGPVVAAAVLVTAALAGGLAWALAGGDDEPGGDASAREGKDAVAGSSRATGAASADGPARVALDAVRDRYTGPCPPPAAAAPAFSATVTVGRVPVEVTYRWVTGSGKVTDGGWRTERFTERRTTVRHTESGRRATDPGKDWIAMEIRSPQRLTSSHVSFTVDCRKEPKDGTSSPAPPSRPGSPSGRGKPSASAGAPSGTEGTDGGTTYGGAVGPGRSGG
ncbi:serine/threonine-protein kinase [Streptomyces albireticuli]|uniref:non-specific serine/threonine protein kinase n=1 Tax=Streptomyces albireticuli TaxID=1940 RepID=A0A2A2D709_9ACTN|nr:serine/threonine-protein kinase [Streptomyces albireticuli]MCD9143491.1 serine/threonine protein kinase [Streptomyces albireticuli]MCD9164850.1 serine/threonine protein kinase [Streptomyces albireticuli]MCD9191608.1 serine/threonine protein kinase [Streptomyces albireticuli]PAU47120.1 serine/threonine protein kinase [Streptomyces albireticuli]